MVANPSASALFLVFCAIVIGPLGCMGFTHDSGTLATHSKALHRWCLNERSRGYQLTDRRCCADEYRCDWFINPGGEKDNLKNSGKTRRRSCDCEKQFFECLTDFKDYFTSKLIGLRMGNQMCGEKNPKNGTYSWISASDWLVEYDRFAEPPVESHVVQGAFA